MEVYQACGSFSASTKLLSLRTMLPEPKKDTTYSYRNYYNISTPKTYGILAILNVDNGINQDLRRVRTGLKLREIGTTAVDLRNLPPSNGGKDFNDLRTTDTIVFFCWHDDEFDVITTDTHQLEAFKDILDDWKGGPIRPKTAGIRQPKVGNGGILSFTGSCPIVP